MKKYLTAFSAIAFAALLTGGLAVSLISLKAVPEKDWQELKDIDRILSGESTRRFTKLLNQHFVLGPAFNRIERGLLWNFTGDLGPGVRAGCGDWLFLADELQPHPDRQKSAAWRAELASQLDNRLKERGIRLLMVVVPDKTRIEASHLCALNRSKTFENRISVWLDALKDKGVATMDLTQVLSAMSGERYYRTDTHWNEAGSQAAALAIAQALKVCGWADLAGDGQVKLDSALTKRPGDLVHLAGLDGLPAFLRPATEMAQVTKVPSIASDDLFGEESSPTIALIGTSYSRNSNFVPFLEHRLGETIANQARDGGDFFGAAIEYFGSVAFRSFAPKVIIWEVPERVIEMPVKDAEKKWLEALSRSGL